VLVPGQSAHVITPVVKGTDRLLPCAAFSACLPSARRVFGANGLDVRYS
jgi:hypothetical protein